MFAGLAANTTFGLLRTAVMVAVVGAVPKAGYDVPTAVAYVWVGQGLMAFAQLWGDTALAERVRSGDVVVDLYRPWHLQAALFATDIGRAAYSLLIRFTPTVLIGALVFPFHWPEPAAWPVFALSALLALTVSFGVRFLLNASTFWLMDNRGVMSLYSVMSSVLCGLALPLSFFPEWARTLLWATPFPAIIQGPVDIWTGHGPQWTTLAHQVFWAVAVLFAGHVVLGRAVRKVVVQGG
ncbi:ABC-2 family transporter protein [Actinosynnema sp. NPDC023587]|uniref:ABC transporter permease n=1 Tax=Actinosynnema sp. NPDC023587 TaxID=3154695 RepID=UPI0033C1DFD2